MTDEIVQVDDVLLAELRSIWIQEKHRISAIIERLRQEFNIEQRFGWERLILYGRMRDNEMFENIVGWLVAIAPGIVILDTDDNDHLLPLSGLLKRLKHLEPRYGQLFVLRPFSPSHICASLDIYPSTFPKSHKRYGVCPVWISWQIGAGHGESYMTLGIEPGRWETLKPWLDKWLPKQ